MYRLYTKNGSCEDELIRLFSYLTSHFDGEVTSQEDRTVVDITVDLLEKLKQMREKFPIELWED